MKHSVVIEKEQARYGAYVTDLPSSVATRETREEVMHLIHEANEFHNLQQ